MKGNNMTFLLVSKPLFSRFKLDIRSNTSNERSLNFEKIMAQFSLSEYAASVTTIGI